MITSPKPRLRSQATPAALALLALLAASGAQAANRYWDISNASGLTPGTGTWDTSSLRWATGTAPGTTAPIAWVNGDTAFFQTGGTNTVTIGTGGVSALSVTQTTNGTATTIGGTPSLTVTTGSGIVNSGNTAFTINAPLILGSGAITSYTFNSGSTITVGGAISQTGTATISKTGGSLLSLNASNSYSGGTNVTAGRLNVGTSGTLGTNVNTNNIAVSAGANLGLTAISNVGSNQTISISSNSTALGGFGVGWDNAVTSSLPTLNTTGTGSSGGIFGINYTGTAGVTSLATLSSALNSANGSTASGHWFLGSQSTGTFNGATLAPNSDGTYRLGGGGGTLTFNQTNVITGANSLLIGSSSTGGSGTVVFGAGQNYTGSTTVSGGTFKITHADALGDGTNNTTGVTVGGTAIFDLGGVSPTANVPLTLNSTASGFDVGSFTNSVAATATYAGNIDFQAATVRAGANGNAMTLTGTITGNGKNFIKDGSNVMTLTNSGTVSLGTLQIFRGTLLLNSGTTVNPSGTFTLGGGASVSSSLTLSGGSLTVGAAQTANFGSGSGSAASSVNLNSGTLTLPKFTKLSQNFSVNFNGGTLRANAASTAFLSAIGGTAKVLAGGAFIDDGGFAITVGQALVDDTVPTGGGLTKQGSGTLTLSGVNTYTGPTTVSAGTLVLDGTGTIATTSAISVAGGATLTNNNASAVSNAFTVGEGATLNGTGSIVATSLNVSADLSNGFTSIGAGSAFSAGGGLTFNFTNVTAGTYSIFSSSISSAFTSVSIGATALSGTGNFTGIIGDFTYTFTDADDVLSISAVPEPSAFAVFAGLGAIGWVGARRRRAA